ncbi:hypothetical protein ACIRPQ_23855 [Streptomyces sp. NPDC101213]|uniref:hypothetical protein n=1 Tax=Streptomyces sp. NPDC101213 TaxID=3366130 RepID=UPI00381B3F69
MEPAATDTWNGEPLADATSVNEDIHYRIHDADSGALLGFGTGRGQRDVFQPRGRLG